jgi:hypothetical protein
MFGLVERATQDAGPVELLALPAVEPHAVIDSMSSRATCRGVLPTAGHDAALQSSYAGPSNVRAGAGMHIDRARRIFGRGRRHSGESHDTWQSVTDQLDVVNAKLDAAVVDYVKAVDRAFAGATDEAGGTGTALAITSTAMYQLRKQRADLDTRLAKTTRSQPPKPESTVDKAEKDLAKADAKLLSAIDATGDVRTDEEMKTTATALGSARDERARAATKLKRARGATPKPSPVQK